MTTLEASLATLKADEAVVATFQKLAQEALPDWEVYALVDRNGHFQCVAQRPGVELQEGIPDETPAASHQTLRLPGL